MLNFESGGGLGGLKLVGMYSHKRKCVLALGFGTRLGLYGGDRKGLVYK